MTRQLPGRSRHASNVVRPLYWTKRWQRLRLRHLRAQPLCLYCLRESRTQAATVVDHIRPHRGDPTLFYDPANLQSLCADHHDNVKRREEMGLIQAVGDDGWPL